MGGEAQAQKQSVTRTDKIMRCAALLLLIIPRQGYRQRPNEY